MRRILAVLLATSFAFEPVAAGAQARPYMRQSFSTSTAQAKLGPIQGPSPIRTHAQTLVDAQYTVTGGTASQWSATGLPSGLSMSSGGIVSGAAPVPGSAQATITVTDGAQSESIIVPVQVYGNLTVTIPETQSASEGASSTFPAPTVTGDPIQPLQFVLQGGALPPGMSLDGISGIVSGTPTAAGSFTYGVRATDASGADAVSNTQTIAVSNGATVTMAAVVGRVGVAITPVTPRVAGAPNGTLTYALASGSLPAGLTLAKAMGTVSGTPTAATQGDAALSLALLATDGTGKVQNVPFTVQVNAPLSFASASSQAPLVARIGQNFTLPALSLLHNPALPGTWSLASGQLPPGIRFNAQTGQFYGPATGPVGSTNFAMTFVDANKQAATSGSLPFKILSAVTIDQPSDASADTGQTLYAPTPTVEGKTIGTLAWSLVDDGPALQAAGQAQTPPGIAPDADPIPSGVTIDPKVGQVSGTSQLGSISTAHYEVADQSGAPPVASPSFHISFLTDFKVGQVAGVVSRIGDTDHTATPTITNTRTGQILSNDSITWSDVCHGPGYVDYGLSGISLDPATGRYGGTAGYPSKVQGTSDGWQIYAVDAYHQPAPGGPGASCPSYGDLATNSFTYSILYPLQMDDVLLGSHVGLPVSLVPLVRNQAIYPLTWTLSSGALPQGLTLSGPTPDYTYPVIYGSVATPADTTVVLHGEDSSVHEASVDGTGHDFVTASIHVQVTPEPTLGAVADETGRTLVGHGIAAPAVSGTVVGAQHWTLKDGTGAGLLSDASGNPTGLTLSESTGTVSGVPVTPIHTSVTLHFVDDAGGPGVDAQPYRVDILPALVIDNPAPTVNGALAFDTHTGTASVPTSPSIENGPTGAVTWTLNGVSPMPPGLSFDVRTGILSGTPTDTSSVNGTTFPDAYLSVVDQASPVPATAVSKPFALNVFPALAVAVTPDVNYVRVGDAFSMAAPAVSNGPVSPLVWTFASRATDGSALSTTLPTGLTMDANGNIGGTPTAALNAPAGHFAYKVTDATGAVGLQASPFLFDVEPPLAADAPADLVTYVGGKPSTPPFYGDNSPTGPPNPHLTVHNKPVGRLSFSVKGGASLPGGLALDPSTGVISGIPSAPAAKAPFQVHVADQSLAGDAADTPAFNVTVQPVMTLAATSPDFTFRVGVARTYVPAQPSHPVGAVKFAASTSIPGASYDVGTGTTSNTPGSSLQPTAVTYTVTDQGVPPQSLTTTANLTVLAPLAIEAIATQPAGRVGTAYRYAGPFVADNVQAGHPVAWAYAPNAGIPGVTVDPGTGALSGTPSQVGTFPVSLVVSDDLGATSQATPAQNVLIRQPLSESNVTTSDGQTVSTTTLALNVTGSVPAPTVGGSPTLPLTYTALAGMPAGMTIDSGSGAISGVPTVSGTYVVYVQVQDYDGSTAVTGENVVVTPPSSAQARLVTHSGAKAVVPAQATSGNPATPVVWSLASAPSSVPQGMIFNADGTMSGTAATAGVYSLQATAKDANGNVLVGPDGSSTTISWQVEVRPQLTVSTVQNGVLRALVSGKVVQAPAVAGNPLLPLAFTIAGDKLPSDLAFSAPLGTISGTPANADVGVYNETVTVTDATGVSVTSPAFKVTVTPGLVATAPSAVTLHVGQAPTAAATAPTVQNSVGTPSWALASGTLPAGLSVDPGTGALTGKATTAGSVSVALTVTDPSDGLTATTASYGITVSPAFVASAPTLSSQGHPGYASTGRPSVDSNASGIVTWAFSAATNVPTGFSVAPATGVLSTTTSSATGTYSVAETATDGTGQTGDTSSFNVSVVPPVSITTPFNASRPKVALSTSSPLLLRNGVDAKGSVTGSFGLSNAIGTPTFSMTAAPAGLSISTAGAMSGAPTATSSVSSGNLSVTGSDSSPSGTVAGSGQATLAVPFSYYGSALGLSAYANGSYFNGDAVSVPAPTQSGSPVNAVLKLNTVSGALPSGLAFNSDGSVTGTASTGGTGAFTVTLTDDTGGTYTTPQFTLTVSGATLASAAYPSAFANGSGTTPAGSLAALYDGSAATTSSVSTTKANGVVLTFASNTAWDGSVDTDLSSGTYAVEYNAGTQASPSWTTYASGTVASTQFRVSGTAAATPARFRLGYKSAFPHLLPSLTGTKVYPVVGTAYLATLDNLLATANATGVETWTLLSGTVPAGMTLDTQGGTLKGTPTAYGDAPLSLAVTDADGVASVPVNLVVSVQSNLQASVTYPASAVDVGSGATPKNPNVQGDGTDPTSVALAVAAGYDASAATGPLALAIGHNFNPNSGQGSSAGYGTSYWSGVQYNFAQAVSWDGSVDLATIGSPSTTLYYNTGSASSPVWTVYSASFGPVTTVGVQVIAASTSASVQVTKARLGYGSAYPAYLPSATAASTVALQGGTVGLDALMTPANVRSGDAEAWASTALPAGVTVSGATLQVASSTAPGTYAVPMTVADSRGLASAPATLSLTVDAPPALVPSSATATYGAAYSGVLNTVMGASNVASGATWTVTGAPTGYAVSGTGTTAPLAVTAANQATTGSYPVTVKVANTDGGTSTATLTLSVAPGLQAATVTTNGGTAYSGSLVTPMSATGPSLSWAVGTTGNTLPSGVAVSSTGTLTVASTVAAGTYSAPVTVTSNAQVAMATLTVTVTVPQANPSSGLLAYWKLDERSGTTAADATGNGYTLTATGASPFPGAGLINGGAAFGGSTSASSPSLGTTPTGAAARTISTWFKTSTTSGYQALMGYGGTFASGNIFELCLNGSTAGSCGNGIVNIMPSASYGDGSWHMLTATYDGTNSKVYFDGALQVTQAIAMSTTASPVMLGNEYARGGLYYTGLLDEPGLWNRALTAAEVSSLYNSGTGLQGPSFANNDATVYAASVVMAPNVSYTGSLATLMNGGANAARATYAITSGSLPTGLTLTSGGTLSGTPTSSGNSTSTVTATNPDGTTSSATLTVSVTSFQNKLLSYWKFDEGTGTSVSDSQGAVNGTWGGTVSGQWAGGQINKGGVFNGSDYVSLGTPASLEGLQNNLTIAGWVNTTTTGGTQPFYAGYSGVSGGGLWSMLRDDSGTLTYYTSNSSGGYQSFAGPTLSANAWHFVAVTVSGPSTAPVATITVDGTSKSTTLAALGTAASNTIMIGGDVGTTSERWNGAIDEVGVWGRALTTAELTALYNSGNGLQGPAFSGYGATLYAASVTVQVGTAYSGSLPSLMNGGVNATKATYSVTAGALPSGLSLSSAGLLSGTTTAAGTFTPTITATNPDGTTGAATLTVTVPGLQAGLVRYYKMDEGSGTTLADATGNANATLSNATWTTGIVGKAVTLAGASNSTANANFGLQTGNAPRTLSAWFKTTSTQNGMLVSYGSTASNGFFGIIAQGNGTNVGITAYGGGDTSSSIPTVFDGKWHMATATYDGTIIRVYVDSKQVATNTTQLATSSSALNIGAALSSNFAGTEDEVGVWNRALSAAEVSILYNSGAAIQGPFTSYISAATVNGALGSAMPATQLAGAMSGSNVQNATWSVTSGSLPGGMTVSSSGTLSGTPTQAGSYPVTVVATNPDGSTASATLTVAVYVTSSAFDGSTSYVTMPTSVMANLYSGSTLNGYTVEGWVNFSSSAAWARVMEFNSATGNSSNEISLGRDSSGSTFFGSTAGGGVDVNAGTITNGSWTHVALTQAGSTMTLYVNGVQVQQNTSARVPANVSRPVAYLGKSSFTADPLFAGQMADLQVYNRALTAAEVASTKKGATAPGIVARYLTTAAQGADATGNGNAGTGTGTFTTSTFLPN